jgi:uncharacterized membrane protein HdeD (DUF308 family)
VGAISEGTLAPPVPTWLVLTQGIAAVLVALVQLTQPGVDNLLTMLALLGVYWLLGGILELVDLALAGRRWAWRLAGASAGIAAGFVVLREPLWSTLLMPELLAPTMGWFGLAAGVVYLVRALAGGGRGALVLGAQSLALGVVPLIGSPQLISSGGAAVRAWAGRPRWWSPCAAGWRRRWSRPDGPARWPADLLGSVQPMDGTQEATLAVIRPAMTPCATVRYHAAWAAVALPLASAYCSQACTSSIACCSTRSVLLPATSASDWPVLRSAAMVSTDMPVSEETRKTSTL